MWINPPRDRGRPKMLPMISKVSSYIRKKVRRNWFLLYSVDFWLNWKCTRKRRKPMQKEEEVEELEEEEQLHVWKKISKGGRENRESVGRSFSSLALGDPRAWPPSTWTSSAAITISHRHGKNLWGCLLQGVSWLGSIGLHKLFYSHDYLLIYCIFFLCITQKTSNLLLCRLSSCWLHSCTCSLNPALLLFLSSLIQITFFLFALSVRQYRLVYSYLWCNASQTCFYLQFITPSSLIAALSYQCFFFFVLSSLSCLRPYLSLSSAPTIILTQSHLFVPSRFLPTSLPLSPFFTSSSSLISLQFYLHPRPFQ